MNLSFSIDHKRIGVHSFSIPDSWMLVVLAAALRLVNLSQESLWYDETFTAWIARLQWPNMWAAIRGDVHPPLWYVIEWGTTRLLGRSELALRLPSALLGIVAVFLVHRLALALHLDRRTAFLAGLLAAFLPNAIYYSQDARMYDLLACCVLVAAIAAIEDRWPLFTLAGLGAVYTQNLGLLYVAILGLVVVLTRIKQPGRLVAPALAGAAIVIGWLPWAPTMIYQSKAVAAGFWLQSLSLGGALYALPAMTMGQRLGVSWQMHVYGVAIALTLVSVVVFSRRLKAAQPGDLIVLAVAFGMPLLAALISILWRSIYLPRAMLPAALAITILWAYALENLSKPNKRLARALLVPMMAVALWFHYFPAQGGRMATRDWAVPVSSAWQDGDVVFHIAIDSSILFAYYLPDKPAYLLPEATDLNQSLTVETKAAMGFKEARFDDLRSMGYRRVWLIDTPNPMSSQVELNESDRILRTYHHTLIKTDGNEFAQEYIYLVDLTWPQYVL